jgi:imidazolonepropionase-like amidohydrolase
MASRPQEAASLPASGKLALTNVRVFDAGLSPRDALRAATSRPARSFGLPDRGAIEPGLRADLVLIEGDPLRDIRATRSIRRIWCGGYEVQPAGTGT